VNVATAPSPIAAVRPLMRGWLHVGGFIVLLATCPVLYARVHLNGQVWWVTCFVVGVALMMATSATLHLGHWSPVAKRVMQRADRSTIFAAIAGSYFAIAGLTLHGTVRWALLSFVGAFAVIAVALQRVKIPGPAWIVTVPYLAMGWAAVAVMPQIYRGGGALCLALIVTGGVAYTIGAICFGLRRPRLAPRVFGFHELFHACTLVGAGCTFAAIAVALR
jgi:hemolysin III